MRKIVLPLLLLLVIAVSFTADTGFTVRVNAQEEFPHVEASKTVTPSRVEKDGVVEVTISLRGAGGVIPTPVDVVLILDRSGSMLGSKIRDAKEAAKIFLDYMDEKDRAGLVYYNYRISSVNLTYMTAANKEALKRQIDAAKAQGATDIYDAILAANQLLLYSPRAEAPLVEVLLTDGLHNFPTELPDSEFEALALECKRRGIIIYTVGLGADVNERVLQLIAETTGGEYYFAAKSEELEGIYREIATKLSFAGTNIVVTETLPPFLAYNRDASKAPDEESTSEAGLTFRWNVGTLKVGESWEVTYTARAEEALELDPAAILCRVEYITAEKASAIINLPPGFLYHGIAITGFAVETPNVTQGELVNVTVSLLNHGIVRDSFELRTDVNGTLIDSREITLNPGGSTTLLIQWNTSDVDPGIYRITVKADPDNRIWESNRADNTASGLVEVKQPIGEFWWIIVLLIIVVVITLAGITYAKYFVAKKPVVAHRCPRCGSPLGYSRVARRWYCPRCGRYYDIRVYRKTPPPRPRGKPPSTLRAFRRPPPPPTGRR
ncbi:MAG: VWA domain-containing protein [Candidatus Bathyarchaeia archaeon]|nr:VWA domain-containing protein [Candidatus Bathyarchaeota archaeon]